MTNKRLGRAYGEYRESANPFVNMQDKTYEGWLAFRHWYKCQGRQLFVSAFLEASGKKLPRPRSTDWLINTVIASTDRDYEKKIAKPEYYRAHAFWFLEEMDRIVERTPSSEEDCGLVIAYADTLNFVENLMIDSLVLLRETASLHSGLDESGLHKNPVTQLREFYVTARYLIYGAFAVGHHSDVSISVIRQALEIRLRRAFGVIAKVDSSGTQHPIPLSEIITVLERFSNRLDMTIPLCSLKRINGWANMYLHSGFKEYAWAAPRVLEYLSTFLLGGRPAPGYLATVNGGVITDKETFRQIREQLQQRYEPDFQLLAHAQEHCDLVITPEPAETR